LQPFSFGETFIQALFFLPFERMLAPKPVFQSQVPPHHVSLLPPAFPSLPLRSFPCRVSHNVSFRRLAKSLVTANFLFLLSPKIQILYAPILKHRCFFFSNWKTDGPLICSPRVSFRLYLILALLPHPFFMRPIPTLSGKFDSLTSQQCHCLITQIPDSPCLSFFSFDDVSLYDFLCVCRICPRREEF